MPHPFLRLGGPSLFFHRAPVSAPTFSSESLPFIWRAKVRHCTLACLSVAARPRRAPRGRASARLPAPALLRHASNRADSTSSLLIDAFYLAEETVRAQGRAHRPLGPLLPSMVEIVELTGPDAGSVTKHGAAVEREIQEEIARLKAEVKAQRDRALAREQEDFYADPENRRGIRITEKDVPVYAKVVHTTLQYRSAAGRRAAALLTLLRPATLAPRDACSPATAPQERRFLFRGGPRGDIQAREGHARLRQRGQVRRLVALRPSAWARQVGGGVEQRCAMWHRWSDCDAAASLPHASAPHATAPATVSRHALTWLCAHACEADASTHRRMEFARGLIYDGDWADDQAQGHAMCQYENGTVYKVRARDP